ncbi:MAG: FAD-binding oxidoreductase [Deltaproteobacteria bacterium]|nr:FAD-binding oxidoreductase [Deltaproteobacteria bacterium]
MKISAEQLTRQLESELGAANVSTEPSTLAAHAVDGKVPALICQPVSAEQLAVALRICNSVRAAVIPWGGGTAMALGNPPRQADVVIATTQLNRLIEHDAANLTVTVQSGMTLNALQAELTKQKQFAPFDAPFPERATLGGIVAANLYGPRRSSWGAVRDLVIGMKVALASGEQIKAGGKVVKNVAGYDMCKLFTGSLGTLGIITELTMRVAPIPEHSASAVAQGSLKQVEELADAINNSKLLPAALFLRGDGEKNWQLAVSFEGFAETVARQLREVDSMAQQLGMRSESLPAQSAQHLWQDLRDLPFAAEQLAFRLTIPRKSLKAMIRARENSQTATTVIAADMALGIIWFAGPANRAFAGEFSRLIELARQERGYAVMFAAPAALKQGVEVWGPTPPAFALMREIKQKFDPQTILNPGRFVAGL